MEHDGGAQAGGEGAVLPLRLSAAATCFRKERLFQGGNGEL